MKIQLLGYKDTDFTNEAGEKIEGRSLFFPSPIDSSKGKGSEIGKKFVSVKSDMFSRLPALTVGKTYDCDFSDKGHFLSIEEVK